MKTRAIELAALLLLTQLAAAQTQFQGLGAADPSQQLKTTGMMTNFQNQATQLRRQQENKEPLVQGTADPGDREAPERSTGAGTAPAPQAEQPVAVTPTPLPSPSVVPPPAPSSTEAPAATWNPAAQASAAAPAPAVSQSVRMSRVQELVDQIKRRREGR